MNFGRIPHQSVILMYCSLFNENLLMLILMSFLLINDVICFFFLIHFQICLGSECEMKVGLIVNFFEGKYANNQSAHVKTNKQTPSLFWGQKLKKLKTNAWVTCLDKHCVQ
jgi:hypothetical protein